MAQRTVNCMYQPMTWSEGNNRNDHYWCSYHQRNNWAEVSFPETCIRQVKKSCIIARISNMMFSHVSAYETQLLSSGMATSEHHHLVHQLFPSKNPAAGCAQASHTTQPCERGSTSMQDHFSLPFREDTLKVQHLST